MRGVYQLRLQKVLLGGHWNQNSTTFEFSHRGRSQWNVVQKWRHRSKQNVRVDEILQKGSLTPAESDTFLASWNLCNFLTQSRLTMERAKAQIFKRKAQIQKKIIALDITLQLAFQFNLYPCRMLKALACRNKLHNKRNHKHRWHHCRMAMWCRKCSTKHWPPSTICKLFYNWNFETLAGIFSDTWSDR